MEDLYDIDGSLNEQKLETIGEQAGYPNKFDPNNIGDKDVIYIGATTSRDVPKIMAIASQGSSLYIYEISPEMIQGKKGTICSCYWELTPESGLVENYRWPLQLILTVCFTMLSVIRFIGQT